MKVIVLRSPQRSINFCEQWGNGANFAAFTARQAKVRVWFINLTIYLDFRPHFYKLPLGATFCLIWSLYEKMYFTKALQKSLKSVVERLN